MDHRKCIKVEYFKLQKKRYSEFKDIYYPFILNKHFKRLIKYKGKVQSR